MNVLGGGFDAHQDDRLALAGAALRFVGGEDDLALRGLGAKQVAALIEEFSSS